MNAGGLHRVFGRDDVEVRLDDAQLLWRERVGLSEVNRHANKEVFVVTFGKRDAVRCRRLRWRWRRSLRCRTLPGRSCKCDKQRPCGKTDEHGVTACNIHVWVLSLSVM